MNGLPAVVTLYPMLAMSTWRWIILILVVAYAFYFTVVLINYVGIWRAARAVAAPLTLGDIIKMRWSKIDPRVIIEAYQASTQHHLELTIEQIRQHYSRGGRVPQVIKAMGLARSHKIRASWKDYCQRDLHGENVLQEVHEKIEEIEKDKEEARRHEGT